MKNKCGLFLFKKGLNYKIYNFTFKNNYNSAIIASQFNNSGSVFYVLQQKIG